MTRATLLHVLDRPTALGPAEVRELEQLAQAFPYCQTAHLLLAKAAHDQGTMLAGQRLRRAATYAADRTLLRRLIELVEPVPNEEPAPAPTPAEDPRELPAAELPPRPEPAPALAPPAVVMVPEPTPAGETPGPAPATFPTAVPTPVIELPAPEPVALPEAEPLVAPAAAAPAPSAPVTAALVATEPPLTPAEASRELPAAELPLPPASVAEAAPAVVATALPLPAAPEPPMAPDVPEPAAEISAPTVGLLPSLPNQADAPATVTPAPPAVADAPTSELPSAPLPEPTAEPAAEPDLPAQAPAIRPPVEVGEARFEFGLAEPAPPVVPTYELPGLIDEWAASAVTLSLGSPDTPAPASRVPSEPVFTAAAFTGDATVGYALGESSRLGLSMQLLDLLAARAEAAEAATAVVAAAQPPAVVLPPAGTFFEPDPLLLDYWTTHRPPPPALPTSLDLINNFLKRQPRLTRPAMLPPTPGGQADLSARSTRAEPDLISENLARIYVRQGKPQRAIEIYERLIVKHPEKAAYFSTQIQLLNSAG